VSLIAWHRPLTDRPWRLSLVSVGTTFRTDSWRPSWGTSAPAVRGPQGVGEHVEGVAPLLELAKLGAHLVKGGVLVTGAELELLSPTSQNP
jgi:hypothetical protein